MIGSYSCNNILLAEGAVPVMQVSCVPKHPRGHNEQEAKCNLMKGELFLHQTSRKL